jgi:CotH kinase protein
MRKILLSCFAILCLSATYAQGLYDSDRIPVIKIQFKAGNWSKQLDSLKSRGLKERMVATVEVDGKVYDGVGVRYKGNSSYKNPRKRNKEKLPFNLKASYVNKDQRFPGGYETMKLGNVFMDPSFVRENVSYEIARKYMPAPQCNFAKVYVNGEFIGLYTNIQSIDSKFLEDSFGTTNGSFFKCDPEWEDVIPAPPGCKEGEYSSLMYVGDDAKCYGGWYELESKGEDGWKDLVGLSKTVSLTPESIPSKLNVDMTLWMHAFNHVLVNLDSYTGRFSHNFYLYKTPDGLMTPLIWDLNISFGGFRLDGEKQGELNNEELQQFSLFSHFKNKNPKRPLITNVLANPLWRKVYIGHCRTILVENFSNGEYLKMAEKMQANIRDAVKEDPNKLYSFEDFEKNLRHTVDIGSTRIIGVEELMKTRTESLLKHPLFNGKNPVISEVKHTVSGNMASISAKVQDGQKVWLMHRQGSAEQFKQVEMTSGTGGNYTVTIDKPGTFQYYLIAEGDRLAVCSPERASYVFYEVK